MYAVEEPLTAGDLAGFERVSEECGVRIILDESLLRASQLDALSHPERWIVNVRVSKMGGIGGRWRWSSARRAWGWASSSGRRWARRAS